jgi:hypothetical protein
VRWGLFFLLIELSIFLHLSTKFFFVHSRHEIKATQAMINAGLTQINYPLMAAYTYRGKRVLCVSLLPVNGKATLLQGKERPEDAMLCPPPHVDAVMATLGASLCIARSSKLGAEVFGPFDLELHRGGDGLLYVIDVARLFPPEYRRGKNPGARQMYQLLRPELLQKIGIPLVSDALRQQDQEAKDELEDVSNALDWAIESLAHELEAGQHVERLATRADLKALLHGRCVFVCMCVCVCVLCVCLQPSKTTETTRRPADHQMRHHKMCR